MTTAETSILDPETAQRVRASFARQNAMRLIGASLDLVAHGRTEIHLPHAPELEQQHGFIHGGVVGMIADSAAGYAAMSVAAPGASVLTVEATIRKATLAIRVPAGTPTCTSDP